MKFWKILFYLILIIFPFGQLLAFKLLFLSSSVRIQPLDLATFVFLLSWFLFFRKKSPKPFFFWPAVIFLTIASLSFLIKFAPAPVDERLSGFFYLLRLTDYLFLPWAFLDFFKTFKIKVNTCLIYIGIAVGGLSLLQYLLLPDTRFLFNFNWDDHLFRAIGPFLDPSFNGLILVFSSIVLWATFLAEKAKKKKCHLFAGGLVLAISVGLSFSRMNYLFLAVSLMIIFFVKRKFKILSVLLVFFVISVVIFPKPTGEGVDLLRQSTSFAKLDNYKMTISIIKDNFWTGVGFNFMRREQLQRGYLSPLNWRESHSGAGADNSFLFVFATMGVIGFLSYLYYWWIIAVHAKKLILGTTFLCLLGSAFFINSLFYSWNLCWLGFVLADFMAGTDK